MSTYRLLAVSGVAALTVVALAPAAAFAAGSGAAGHGISAASAAATANAFKRATFTTYTSPASSSVRVHSGISAKTATSSTATTNAVALSAEAMSALSAQLTSKFTWPASATLTGTIDWGDGNSGTFTSASGSASTETHTYAKPGTYTITETVTDGTTTVENTDAFTTAGNDYTADGPTRLLDTRTTTGGHEAPVTRNQTVKVKIAGNGDIPSGVTAVVLNLTATEGTRSGNVSAYGDGDGLPETSNVNYGKGQTDANLAVVPVGADGYVDLYNSMPTAGSVDLIADVEGYFTATSASGYSSLTDPYRLLDTRTTTGGHDGQVAPLGTVQIQVAGADSGDLPSTGITAVSVNITVTNTHGGGYLTAYGDGAASVPTASNINFGKGGTVANADVVPVGADGMIDIYNGEKAGAGVDVVVDVNGYYSANGASAYVPIPPTRLLDTRQGVGPLTAGEYYPLPLGIGADQNGDPIYDPSYTSFVLNTTVTNTKSAGFLTVAPDPNSLNTYLNGNPVVPTPPNSSTLNWVAGQTVPNLVQASTGSTGIVDVFNRGTNDADLIVDVFGFYQND
jgi:hypothetical protein